MKNLRDIQNKIQDQVINTRDLQALKGGLGDPPPWGRTAALKGDPPPFGRSTALKGDPPPFGSC